MIRIAEPMLGEIEERLVLDVLGSGRLAQGPMVERFEEAVREAAGTGHAVAMNSGTSALIVAMLAHGIGPGDEVITSPSTFVATLNAILFAGATPRFVDVGEDFEIDPDGVAAAIGRRTRAILPVHLYGYPADLPRIAASIGDRPIALIEDASQAIGACVDARPVGSFGTGCFSFYATKNVTTGEGGALTTDDADVAAAARAIANQGQRARYDYVRPGLNLRMSELQAAVGVGQMTRLAAIVAQRRANARTLAAGLVDVEGLVLPTEAPGRIHVYHHFTVRVTTEARRSRDDVLDHLRRRGIDAGVYYPRLVYDYECFRGDPRVGSPSTPKAQRMLLEAVSLPVHPGLEPADLDVIVSAVREVLA